MTTDYEQARLLVISRNRARLLALGVTAAVQDLTESLPAPKQKQKKKREKQPTPPAGRVRRSKRRRTQDEDAENDPEDDEFSAEALELAKFKIDGTCPKCARVVTKGHANHLENCLGRPKSSNSIREYTLAELVQLQVQKIQTEEKKLQELEMGGLIDLTDEQATFMVVGSTGKHYRVELTDSKRKCQCVDCRIRKHDCKHIRLLLQSLGIADAPNTWLEATKRRVCEQADS